MTLQSKLLSLFRTYLFYDVKLKNSKVNNYSITSRFKTLCKYFGKTDFNRENFIIFLEHLKSKGYKNSYLNSFIKTAKLLDKFLKLEELQDFTYFRVRFEPKLTLPPQDIKRIIDCPVVYNTRSTRKNAQISAKFKALFTLMAYTGCRVGEALDLRYEDVFPTYVIFRDTKTNEDRKVPISQETYALIKGYCDTYAIGCQDKAFGIAFSSAVNEELNRRTQILSLPHISAHTLRYSFITTMCSLISEDSVMRIVGHKDPTSTARYNQKKFEQLRTDLLKHPNYRNSISLDFVATSLTKNIEYLLGSERFSVSTSQDSHKFALTISERTLTA